MQNNLCEKCNKTDCMIGGSIRIHSMQKLPDGKIIRYKSTYVVENDQGGTCNPCYKYKQHDLEFGAVECDYFGNTIK